MLRIALTCANADLNVDAQGIFHLRWAPGSTVSAGDVHAVVAAVRGVTEGPLQPMIVEVVEVFLGLEPRVTLLGTRFVSAVALVGATVVDRVMAAALLREQECPHGYFTSVEDAREWLKRLPVPEALEESTV